MRLCFSYLRCLTTFLSLQRQDASNLPVNPAQAVEMVTLSCCNRMPPVLSTSRQSLSQVMNPPSPFEVDEFLAAQSIFAVAEIMDAAGTLLSSIPAENAHVRRPRRT